MLHKPAWADIMTVECEDTWFYFGSCSSYNHMTDADKCEVQLQCCESGKLLSLLQPLQWELLLVILSSVWAVGDSWTKGNDTKQQGLYDSNPPIITANFINFLNIMSWNIEFWYVSVQYIGEIFTFLKMKGMEMPQLAYLWSLDSWFCFHGRLESLQEWDKFEVTTQQAVTSSIAWSRQNLPGQTIPLAHQT